MVALPFALSSRLRAWANRHATYRASQAEIGRHVDIERLHLPWANHIGLVKDAHGAGAVSWMVSGHATWKAGPLLHVAKAIPEAETINNVDQQVLAMAFAIIRYFGDKSAGSKR